MEVNDHTNIYTFPHQCGVVCCTVLWCGVVWYVCVDVCEYLRMQVQWNLSIEDTFGTQLAVLYIEVSLIQRLICAQFYVVGTADSVLIREVSLIQR